MPARLTRPLYPPAFYRQRPEARKLLVLVHGITGDGTATWTNANGTYWPALIASDRHFDAFDIYVYGYASAFFRDCAPIPDLAKEVNTRLTGVIPQYQEIVFLAHSQGGLIVRQSLLGGNVELQGKTKLFVFYGTPTGGSPLADRASIITKCVDDLRQLELNSFLKQQVYHWEESPLQQRIDTYCVAESDAKVVGAASAFLLCSKRTGMRWGHTELVRPACENDYRHDFLRTAVASLNSAPQVQEQMALDDVAQAFANQYRSVEQDRDILAFWTDIGNASATNAAEAKALLELARAPRAKRLAAVAAALERPSLAKKFYARQVAVIRAVVALDVTVLDEIATLLPHTPMDRSRDDDAAKSLQHEKRATRAPTTATKHVAAPVDASITDFVIDIEGSPQIKTAIIEFLSVATPEERQVVRDKVRRHYKDLPPNAQTALQTSFVAALLRMSSHHWRAGACALARAIGAYSKLGEAIVDDYRGKRRFASLVSADCLDTDQLKEIAEFTFQKTFSESSFSNEYDARLTEAIRFLPAHEARSFADRAAPFVTDATDMWQRRLALSMLHAYIGRPDIKLSRPLWQKAMQDEYGCVNNRILELIAKRADPADASAVWQAILGCREKTPKRDWANIVDIVFALRQHVPAAERKNLFFHAVNTIQGTWTTSLSSDQISLLETFAGEVPDSDIVAERLFFLHWIAGYDVLNRHVTAQLAKVLMARVAVLTSEEVAELERIATTATTTRHGEWPAARAFFKIFAHGGLGTAATSFIDKGPTAPALTAAAIEESAFNILRGATNLDERDRRILAQAPATRDLLDQAAALVKDHPQMTPTEEDLRVRLLKGLRGTLREKTVAHGKKRLTQNPTPRTRRFVNALACDEGYNVRKDVSLAYNVLSKELDPRTAYTLTSELLDCGPLSGDTTAVRQLLGARIADAATVDALQLVLAVQRRLSPEDPPDTDRVWSRISELVQSDPSSSAMSKAATILKTCCGSPSRDAARRMVSLPFLNDELSRIVIAKSAEAAKVEFRDWWSAVAWVSRPDTPL